MPILTIQKLDKAFGSRPLFVGASLGIDDGETVGFIGANGAGKSTLFRILAGIDKPDAGEVAIRRGARVGYLAQEPQLDPNSTIRQAVAAGRQDVLSALTEYHALSERISAADSSAGLLATQDQLFSRIEALGGWQWEHEVERLLTELQVSGWDRPIATISGGERKRVALASVLLDRPDLLLLDEPTNHLDADTTLWLENRLLDYPGTVLLITHDRYLLDRVASRMVELENGGFTSFSGGYSEYLEAVAERDARRGSEAAKRQKQIQRELEWVRRSPAARTGKQKARIKRLEAVNAQSISAPRPPLDAEITFAPPPRLGRTVLDLHDVTKAYAGRTLIRDLSTRMRAGERIGIIGPNGAGKTTLLRLIAGLDTPDSGSVVLGTNTRVVYFDQQRSGLDPHRSVRESVTDGDWVEFGGQRQHVVSYLEDFLFTGATLQQRVGSLSGGERNRLLLAKLLLEPANLLLLDEPTNDLDLMTLRVLEAALVEFSGSVMVVTHDRFFLDKVATGLLVFEPDGEVRRHEGGFELYRKLREQEAAAAPTPAAASPAPRQIPAKQPSRPRRLTYAERSELATIEDRILEAEQERDEIATKLMDPRLYADNSAQVAQLREGFEAAERKIEALYARWAELDSIGV